MEKNIQDLLERETPGVFHDSLLTRAKALVEMSRSKMSAKYPEWDRHDDIYQGIRTDPDKEDAKARERKEPTKMVIPMAHAQVQTFVAFAYSILFQREYFFELTPMGADADKAAAIGEALLQRDLDHFNYKSVLYQFLLDIARFGLGVTKESWVEESQWVYERKEQDTGSFLGKMFKYGSQKTIRTKKIKYQGNKVINISPYRFFPDPRLPLGRFQEGEFVASEDEYSYAELKQMEADGLVSGIDFIPNLNKDSASEGRKNSRMTGIAFNDEGRDKTAKGNIVITEIIMKLIPSQVMIDEKTPLGTEKQVIKYLIWYANDSRMVKCVPYDYLHDQFCYSVGKFSPDLHHFLNDGLSGIIDQLQEVITWFVNSHITSVRKVIQNMLVVDPEGIVMDDLRERRPVIRLKDGMGRLGIDRYIKQLEVHDVTGNHMEDAKALQQVLQIVTGISDNALGQFNQGRRSATEAKNVSTGVSSRLKMHVSLIYYDAIEPQGRRMLSNLRDGLTLETYIKVFGVILDPAMQGFGQFVKATSDDLVGDYDFEVFDGTLPSEKQYQAETVMEAIQMCITNPQLAMVLGLDIKKLIFELFHLRGIRHPERFMLDQAQMAMVQQAMMGQQQQQPTTNGKANGQPSSNGSAGENQVPTGGGQRQIAPSPGMVQPPML